MFEARAPTSSRRFGRAITRQPSPLSAGLIYGSIASFCLVARLFGAADPLAPPPEPDVAPSIASSYVQDANQDRIADALFERAEQFETFHKNLEAIAGKSRPKAELAVTVDVELIFDRQITQEQLDAFTALGGEILYIYRSVSYGWNGRLPIGQVLGLPHVMGATLLLVDEPRESQMHLNVATRTGRVRPIWTAGFAGTPSGYSGSTNVTIAILDSGVDESHSDLNGRRVYWTDFSADASATPVDVDHHGSHVTGIALGTGQASGSGTSTLKYTQFGTLGSPVPNGSFFPSPIELPASAVDFHMTAIWNGGGNTTLHLVSHPSGNTGSYVSESNSGSGASPRSFNTALTGVAGRLYSPGLLSAGNATVSNFVVISQITNYTGIGDGFNKLRGIAPGCNWAGAKVFQNDGSGNTGWIDAAIDDLVSKRVSNRVRVMNLSLGAIGDPGLSTSTRQKVNTAVNNGILMVISAGNDGGKAAPPQREIDDPGRAAMALTVAAANDVNQLTDYTSVGFTNPGSTAGQEEDFKPDVMAPGGSASAYSFILSVDSNNNDGPFADQQADDYTGLQGTSMASPFVAGCAALVVDAMQKLGTNWDTASSRHSRFVKMLLCATSSESNTNREGGANSPTLERNTAGSGGFPIGKDRFEGYGMINPDAAVAALHIVLTAGGTNLALGPLVTDRRVWACTVNLASNRLFNANLTVPGTGDFDLYLYGAAPSAYGTPILLASSAQSGNGTSEALAYTASTNASALLVVKRVSGSGTFTLTNTLVNAPPVPFNPGLQTTTNIPAAMSTVKLATDSNSDPLSFTVSATSAQGGTVALVGGVVTYTPPAGFSGTDTFTYTANDGYGGTTNGTVTVTITTGQAVSLNIVFGPTIQTGNFVVRFAGIPGRTYTIERSTTVNGPWTKATNLTAPTSNGGFGIGVFEFSEATGGDTSRFFRTVYPAY